MRAMVIWGNSLAKLSQKAHFLWAVNPNNAKSTFCAKNFVEIEQLERTLNNPGRLALNKNSGSFWLFFFVFFFITLGHITFHDIVLSCIFLLWTCCNIKELTQAWTKCVKVIDLQSFRLFQLTEVKLVANRKLHSYYFFSTWFARRFFAKQKGTDQLSIENYTECRAIKSAIHYWFHWFWMHTEVAVFNIYLNCRKRSG